VRGRNLPAAPGPLARTAPQDTHRTASPYASALPDVSIRATLHRPAPAGPAAPGARGG